MVFFTLDMFMTKYTNVMEHDPTAEDVTHEATHFLLLIITTLFLLFSFTNQIRLFSERVKDEGGLVMRVACDVVMFAYCFGSLLFMLVRRKQPRSTRRGFYCVTLTLLTSYMLFVSWSNGVTNDQHFLVCALALLSIVLKISWWIVPPIFVVYFCFLVIKSYDMVYSTPDNLQLHLVYEPTNATPNDHFYFLFSQATLVILAVGAFAHVTVVGLSRKRLYLFSSVSIIENVLTLIHSMKIDDARKVVFERRDTDSSIVTPRTTTVEGERALALLRLANLCDAITAMLSYVPDSIAIMSQNNQRRTSVSTSTDSSMPEPQMSHPSVSRLLHDTASFDSSSRRESLEESDSSSGAVSQPTPGTPMLRSSTNASFNITTFDTIVMTILLKCEEDTLVLPVGECDGTALEQAMGHIVQIVRRHRGAIHSYRGGVFTALWTDTASVTGVSSSLCSNSHERSGTSIACKALHAGIQLIESAHVALEYGVHIGIDISPCDQKQLRVEVGSILQYFQELRGTAVERSETLAHYGSSQDHRLLVTPSFFRYIATRVISKVVCEDHDEDFMIGVREIYEDTTTSSSSISSPCMDKLPDMGLGSDIALLHELDGDRRSLSLTPPENGTNPLHPIVRTNTGGSGSFRKGGGGRGGVLAKVTSLTDAFENVPSLEDRPYDATGYK